MNLVCLQFSSSIGITILYCNITIEIHLTSPSVSNYLRGNKHVSRAFSLTESFIYKNERPRSKTTRLIITLILRHNLAFVRIVILFSSIYDTGHLIEDAMNVSQELGNNSCKNNIIDINWTSAGLISVN